jgi:hypothetical protein
MLCDVKTILIHTESFLLSRCSNAVNQEREELATDQKAAFSRGSLSSAHLGHLKINTTQHKQ